MERIDQLSGLAAHAVEQSFRILGPAAAESGAQFDLVPECFENADSGLTDLGVVVLGPGIREQDDF